MLGLKDLKEELANTAQEMREMNTEIKRMGDNILTLSSEMSSSMKEMTQELHNTNESIRESLKITSEAITAMKDSFTIALSEAMEKMTNMSIQMNVKDSLIKSLGLESILPDFLKK